MPSAPSAIGAESPPAAAAAEVVDPFRWRLRADLLTFAGETVLTVLSAVAVAVPCSVVDAGGCSSVDEKDI